MRIDLGGWALLLIAVAIAYFICLKASKEGTKLFKYGGYAIGVIILVISLILAISDVGARLRRRRVTPTRTRRTTRSLTVPEVPQLPSKTISVIEAEKAGSSTTK